ncbi:MAG: alanine dehydrogenase [Spirochaetia bacterium]|nr:alanine dehydrogenase [Spirochaetia bacterium]
MTIGIPKEIKDNEFRCAILPATVKTLVSRGHRIIIEKDTGIGSGVSDEEFLSAGAEIMSNPAAVYENSDMIVKVKEPQKEEYKHLREDLILFTFLHLAPLLDLTGELLKKKVIAIAYETMKEENGYLPLLAPMSEIAGRMSIQIGARFLEKAQGGSGILLAGIPGVEPGHVTILGAGNAGANAARIASALGASVTVLDIDPHRLTRLDERYEGRIHTLMSNTHNIEEEIKKADLLIGAVLITGKKAPKLISKETLLTMKKNSIIVDIAIDQGGCIETSRPTSHSKPVFIENDILHYCVPNIPGAVPRTSSFALTNATAPFILEIVEKGLIKAITENNTLKSGINTFTGMLVNKEVAESQSRTYEDINKILGI